MTKICKRDSCDNFTNTKPAMYCSLSCSNMDRKGRTPKKSYTLVCVRKDCGIEYEAEYKNRKYCSHSCSAIANNLGTRKINPVLCANVSCNSEVSRSVFCSVNCRQEQEISSYLSGKIDGNTKYGYATYVKRYLEDRSDNRCEGFDERIPGRCTETRVLTVDHIYNWRDSRPYSVRHLCPTCHALTPNFAGKNRGNGRTWKAKYSQYSSLVVE